jgi:hypothetical protein
MSVFLALGELRQEDQEFKDSFGCIARLFLKRTMFRAGRVAQVVKLTA